MRCRIELLGEIRVVVGGRLVPRFQTMRTAALLGYLALHPGRPHPREQLAELIWPDGDPGAIRNRLNQAVSSMRRQLEPPGVVPDSILRSDRLTIRLMEESIETDVDEFKKLTNTVLTTDRAPEAIVSGQAALNLYRGDLMDGLYDDWIMADRLAMEDAYTQTIVRLTRALASVGKFDEAIACAGRLTLRDPSDESVHQLIMKLYLKSGRPAAARRQFKELTRILAQDGDQPSELSMKLLGRAKEASGGDEEGTPVSGFAIVESAVESSPASLPSFPVPPRPLTGFFGRSEELKSIEDCLGDADCRVLTVTGLGGAGKTRVAIRALENTPQVAWIGLAESEPGAAVADEFVRQWKVIVSSGQSNEEALRQRLALTPGMTVLLDNLDEPSDADRKFLSELLQRVPDLRLVVTARRTIGLPGETIISLGPLAVPQPAEESDLAALAKSPSIALFLQRSQFVRPDLQLNERNAEVIAALCRRLDGLPLAIELAASWARSLSPRQMLDRLEEDSSLLESRRKDLPERHRTMRQVVESTWNMLDPEAQRLFPMLSVFEGRMSLDAMRFVNPDIDVERAADRLVDSSLLRIESSPDEESRYVMLTAIREFAAELLKPDEEAKVRYRHMQFFLRRAERTFEGFYSDKPDVHLLELDQNRPDLYSSLSYCERQFRPDGIKMVRYLAPYWEHRSRLAEGREWMTRMIKGEEVDPGVSFVLISLARLEWLSGEYAQAESRLNQVLKAISRSMAGVPLALTYMGLALERHRQGDYEAEAVLLDRAQETLPPDAGRVAQIRIFLAKGHLAVERHNYDEAQAHYESGLRASRDLKNSIWIGASLLSLGNLAIVREQYDSARTMLYEAMDHSEQAQSQILVTIILPTIARLERRTKHVARARQTLDRLITMAPEQTDLMLECLREHVVLAIDEGRDDFAAKLSGLVDSVVQQTGAQENREQDDYRSAVGVGESRDPARWKEQAMVGRAMGLEHALNLVRNGSAELARSFAES